MTVPELGHGDVLLRPLREGDVAARQALGGAPAVVRAFGGTPDSPHPRPMTRAEAEAWIAEEFADDGRLSWVVEIGGRMVGHARLSQLRRESRKAMYGIGILDRSLWGRGHGRLVTTLVLHHAFESMRLHRVGLKVFAGQERAIRSYLAAGFVREGLEREIHLVDGVWQDDVVMGVLEHEWRRLHLSPRAVAVVVRDGRVLVIRRRHRGRDYTVLPGGGVEPGESPQQAAERELAEEASMRGRATTLLLEGEHRSGRAASYFLMEDVTGEPVLGGDEALAHGPDDSFVLEWAGADDLDSLGIEPEEALGLLRRVLAD